MRNKMNNSAKSVHPEEEEDFFLGEQTRLLIENSRTAVAVNLAIAFLTYLAVPSSQYLWLWLIVAASAFRLAFILWCREQPDKLMHNPMIYFGLLSLITLQGIGVSLETSKKRKSQKEKKQSCFNDFTKTRNSSRLPHWLEV